MMERTALGSRSNCAAQAWPGQATGAALPNRSSRRKSQARSHSPNTVIGHCTHPDPTKHPTRSSLLATSDPRPRSGRQSIPIGHALGNGLVQPIFRPPSRRSPSDCSPSVFRRDAGLKMLCIMDMKLEVIVLPVSDVDRAKRFYATLGFREDIDYAHENFRVVQFTP